MNWSGEEEKKCVFVPWRPDTQYTAGEILRHVIAHEIHHAGQALSQREIR
nr:DinB family protein [Paenibacillus dendritiformis]